MSVSRGKTRKGNLRDQPGSRRRRTINAISRLAGLREGSREVIARGQWDGVRRGTFDSDACGSRGHVLQLHLVRDFVLEDVLPHFVA